MVALAVDAAVGPGVTLDPGRDDYSCDDNSATDNTGLPDIGIDYPAFDETPISTDIGVDLDLPEAEPPGTIEVGGILPADIGGSLPPEIDYSLPPGTISYLPPGVGGAGGTSPVGPAVTGTPGQPIGDADNPVDPMEQPLDEDGTGILSSDGDLAAPLPGDTLEVTEADLGCDGQVCWKKVDKTTFEEFDISCQDQAISGAYTLSITTAEIDYYIVAVGRCKDPGSPDGFGSGFVIGTTGAVEAPPPTPTAQYVWYYTDDNGNSRGFNSALEYPPTFSAPYACNASPTFCRYDVTITNCDGTTFTSSAIAYGPFGSTPAFTFVSKTFVANCP